jgi:hypothetical protein
MLDFGSRAVDPPVHAADVSWEQQRSAEAGRSVNAFRPKILYRIAAEPKIFAIYTRIVPPSFLAGCSIQRNPLILPGTQSTEFHSRE